MRVYQQFHEKISIFPHSFLKAGSNGNTNTKYSMFPVHVQNIELCPI